MKRATIALLALLSLAGCNEKFEWRQKITVTVETPSGEVSGSSVSAVSWQEHMIRTDGMNWTYILSGEAVVVEVAPGRYLFALLTGPDTLDRMGSVAAATVSGQKGGVNDEALFDEVRDKRDRAAGVITLPDYQYPMLVTFEDITDPASVRLVDPADLAASFGPGVRLKSVVLEVTDEPVTEGRVEAVLGWWLKMRSGKYNEMTPLILPNKSPRGWGDLAAYSFWSYDRLRKLKGNSKP